ncbi:hypothetical protein ACH5RR_007151 [Cinchona calisaya]|uniref:Uncharacterized protein n=1 Tax=Cinchona calisaya TaxID=153742 RepID=A0ABD3AR43_9GENT
MQTSLGGSGDTQIVTVALQTFEQPAPEVARVTRKQSRDTAAPSSLPSPPRFADMSIVPRGSGESSRNLPLSKQYIFSYGGNKYTPEKEKRSAGSRDLPWY